MALAHSSDTEPVPAAVHWQPGPGPQPASHGEAHAASASMSATGRELSFGAPAGTQLEF